jgi:tetraacyldisaccharide 4'-kinase
MHARDALGPDVILLDDGFQCRGLKKCLDVVTLGPDALAPGAGYLPWGPLRESPAAIGPEDFVVFVARSEEERRGASCESTVRALEGLRARANFYMASYVDPVVVDGPADAGPAVAVSGIARPEGFEATCRELGIDVCAKIRFDDHHWYGEEDRSMIERVMREAGAVWLVTTEKDFWRMPGPMRDMARAVRVNLRIEQPGFLDSVVRRVIGDE